MAEAAADPLATIAKAIKDMVTLQDRSTMPRVRAINCKVFSQGQDWDHYSVYFRENVRAAYGLAHGDDALNAACCSWIGSKLEAGPTLTAYEGLEDDVKDDWEELNKELSKLYINEEEKQTFLANPGGFKRGSQTLLAYKNELIRRVKLYQPELKNVKSEYERQLVDRFIGGLEDKELRSKIRFECRRENVSLDYAYEYAVDYESHEVQEKAVELASAAGRSILSASASAGSAVVAVPNGLSAYSSHPSSATVPASLPSSSTPMRILERSVDPKVKANEIAIEALKAAQAKMSDSMEIMQKEMNEKMDKIEFLVTANHTIQNPPPPTPRFPYQPRAPFRPYRQPYPNVPGVTGGPGYRMNPRFNPNYRARPASTEVRTVATNESDTATSVSSNETPRPSAAAICAPVMDTQAPAPHTSHFVPPMHPMLDARQQAFPYPSEFWSDHLEYEQTPMGYQQEGQGTYSYYPQYFH